MAGLLPPSMGSAFNKLPSPPSLGDFASKLAGNLNLGAGTAKDPSYPWADVNSRFFNYITIKPERWDQLFPYRLMVIDSANGNAVVGGESGATITVKGGDTNSIVSFEPIGQQWIFTLPISPQQLSITDNFAIGVDATIRGINEQHSGARFKMINCAGTMGVWPYRQSVESPPSSPNILQSVFGGTIEAASNVLNQVNRTINTITSGHPASAPQRKGPETSSQGETSTGYYQAMALQQFLEQYAEAKRDQNNASWRLVFDIPKQNQSFVVTPMIFDWNQVEQRPYEIKYRFTLKAWRRIDLLEETYPTQPQINPISPGILQRILNTITEARKTTAAALDLIGAVRSDVDRPLDVLRQTSLFVKDLMGIAATAADLPFQIQRDYSSSIKDSMNNLKSSISSNSSDPQVRSSLNAISKSVASREGLSQSAILNGQIGRSAAISASIDPADNVFSTPEANFSLMNEVPVYSLSLTDAQQSVVDTVISDSRNVTVDDLKTFRSTIQELALQLSNNFGAGDAYYSQIYGRPAPKERIQDLTVDEYAILKSMYDVMQSYDILTASTQVDDLQKQTSMEYVAGLADLSGIPFEVPTSKILVPVPINLNIEQIAARYLGDPQRWLEIATLNNLRAPYIDEDGFQRSLLSNASGRQITISSIDDMYVGQRVVLMSTTQSPAARRILDIDRLSDTTYLITLDGEANLDNFLIADKAYIQAYLPGTVNSQQKIFIPSDLPVPNDPNIIPPASTQQDTLVGLSKVDWLLTDKGDVATNSYGDFRLSAGMTNIIQALRIKFGTERGKVLLHPEFGLGVAVGTPNSEVDVQEIYNSVSKMIKLDPRFQGVSTLQIQLSGPTLSISVGVKIAGQRGVFPVTFQLPN